MPTYQTNDPKGWCGDPSRGAALGRATIQEGDPTAFTGKLTLRKVRLDSGGYDPNGTYFGWGEPLYWCSCETDEHYIDFILRAPNRITAKRLVREDYPNARFYN